MHNKMIIMSGSYERDSPPRVVICFEKYVPYTCDRNF